MFSRAGTTIQRLWVLLLPTPLCLQPIPCCMPNGRLLPQPLPLTLRVAHQSTRRSLPTEMQLPSPLIQYEKATPLLAGFSTPTVIPLFTASPQQLQATLPSTHCGRRMILPSPTRSFTSQMTVRFSQPQLRLLQSVLLSASGHSTQLIAETTPM